MHKWFKLAALVLGGIVVASSASKRRSVRSSICNRTTTMRRRLIESATCVFLIALTACEQGPGTQSGTEQEETPTYASRMFTVRPADFIIADVPGARASVAAAKYSVPEITKEAIEKGLVEAYVQDTNVGQGWIGLPVTFTLDVGGRTISLSLQWGFEVGKSDLVMSGNVTATEMRPLLSAVVQGYRLRVVVGR